MCSEVRQADRDEVRAYTGSTVLNALVKGITGSKLSYTVKLNRTPIAIFGVVGEESFGTVWLLGTDAIQLIKRPFLRQSKAWLAHLEEGYELVGNVIDARNTLHIRWLHWLGFSFVREISRFGHEQRPFLEFVKLCATPSP